MIPQVIPASDLVAADVPPWERATCDSRGIRDLPAVMVIGESGERDVMLTYWTPTESERAAIAAGAPVMVEVEMQSYVAPAIALSVRRSE